MKKILFLTAAAALTFSGTAHANDFNGFRVEVQTGLDVLSGKESYKEQSTTDGTVDPDSTYSDTDRGNATGLQFGLGVGYDAEISSNIVAGIEASIAFSDAKFRDIGYNYDISDDETFEADDLKAKREIELGARIGYKVNPSTLVYLKGGYVNGRFKLNGETEFLNQDDEWDYRDQSFSKNRGGYRVGAGIETLLGGNTFAKLEYRYTNFKDLKVNSVYEDPDFDGERVYTQSYRLGMSRHQVAASVGVRF